MRIMAFNRTSKNRNTSRVPAATLHMRSPFLLMHSIILMITSTTNSRTALTEISVTNGECHLCEVTSSQNSLIKCNFKNSTLGSCVYTKVLIFDKLLIGYRYLSGRVSAEGH